MGLADGYLGVWPALLAASAWLLFPLSTEIATWIAAETLFTVLLTVSFLLLIVATPRSSPGLMGVAGLILGVSTLFRGTPILLAPAVAAVLLVYGKPWCGVALIAGFALVICPWWIRNRVVLNDNIPVAVGIGSVFLQGSEEVVFDGRMKPAYYPHYFALARQDGVNRPTDGKESSMDNWMMRTGVENYKRRIRERPASFAPFLLYKLVRMWYGTETPSRWKSVAIAIFTFPLALLGLYGVWRRVRAEAGVHLISAVFLAYFIVLHFVTLPEVRYLLPVMPVLMVYAAGTLCGAHHLHGEAGGKAAARNANGI